MASRLALRSGAGLGPKAFRKTCQAATKTLTDNLAARPGYFPPDTRYRDPSVDIFVNRSARKALDTMKTKHGGRTAHGQQASAEVCGRGVP